MFILLMLVLLVVATVVGKIFKNVIDKEEKRHRENYSYESDDYASSKKKLSIIMRIVYGVICGLIVVVGIFSSIFFTNEQEIGFTVFFGKTSRIESSGMHFVFPFLSQKYIYDATTQGMAIGYSEDTDETVEEDSLMITSDFNFVNIDFYLEYRISDPIEYHYGTNDPEGVLRNIAQSAIRNTVGQFAVDSVMTTGKSEIEMLVYEDIVQELSEHHTGLTVLNVTIQDAEPPTSKVASAFTAVENAKQHAEEVINEAHEYENTQIPAAEATAEQIKQAANATKTERENAAKEEVARFNALFQEYQNNPETVKDRLYYEALEEILPNMEIIIGEDSKVIYVKGNNN